MIPLKLHTNAALKIVYALVALLALEPCIWLVKTWLEPAYNSSGFAVFGVAAALFIWSLSSECIGDNSVGRSHQAVAFKLLAATALVRLAGHLLAINILSALALMVDVFALGLLARIGQRGRAVSPFWVAVVFGFSLPIERVFQRIIGYDLQHISATGACGMLGSVFSDVTCAGVDIRLAGEQVMVDLPCSGARGLVLFLLLFATLCAVVRPSFRATIAAGFLTLLAALCANMVRISALAVGIVFPESIGGIDVMAQPWHDLLGLASLAVGGVPIVLWARYQMRRRAPLLAGDNSTKTSGYDDGVAAASLADSLTFRSKILGVICVGAVGATLLFAAPTPVDVAADIEPIELPQRIGQDFRRDLPLSPIELDYFARYGGGTAKAQYGPMVLLAVRTSSPLRHLHAPDECLSGAGYDVTTIGVRGDVFPGATYHATDPDGRRWLVRVSYVSEQGMRAESVAEVVRKWLYAPSTTWTAIERIYPAEIDPNQLEYLESSVLRAFELAPNSSAKLNPEL